MSWAQRKIALINWITDMNNEQLLEELEKLRSGSNKNIPQVIIELLERSDNVSDNSLTEHRLVKKQLK